MEQQYIPVLDSFNTLLGRRLMDINTKELFLINIDGQVMKMVPVAKDGLLSSPDKKIDANKYIDANAKDAAIITELEKRNIKHVANPTTPDEWDYKRARNRINRRKAYVKERAEKLNISLPSANDIKDISEKRNAVKLDTHQPFSICQQLPILFQQTVDKSSMTQISNLSLNPQQSVDLPQLKEKTSKLSTIISQSEQSQIQLTLNKEHDKKSIIDWWNGHFKFDYIKLKTGYFAHRKEIHFLLGEFTAEYFIPNNDINSITQITFDEFTTKLKIYDNLARRLSSSDKSDYIKLPTINTQNFTMEVLDSQSTTMIDCERIPELLNGPIVNLTICG